MITSSYFLNHYTKHNYMYLYGISRFRGQGPYINVMFQTTLKSGNIHTYHKLNILLNFHRFINHFMVTIKVWLTLLNCVRRNFKRRVGIICILLRLLVVILWKWFSTTNDSKILMRWDMFAKLFCTTNMVLQQSFAPLCTWRKCKSMDNCTDFNSNLK